MSLSQSQGNVVFGLSNKLAPSLYKKSLSFSFSNLEGPGSDRQHKFDLLQTLAFVATEDSRLDHKTSFLDPLMSMS